MTKLLILGSGEKEHVVEAIEAIKPWLGQRAEVTVDLDMGAGLDRTDADFAIVFGGDGSVLRAARTLAAHQIPVMAINVGKLGFLTEISSDEARQAVSDLLEGRYRLVERMMLRCELRRAGSSVLNTIGLNDAVISRTALSRLIVIDLLVDGELVTTYGADGLVISTPTGSTGHSLSAGGPIVSPEINAFVVTPICPHTLSNRPLVLPPDCGLEMRARNCQESPAVTVDGQVYERLQENDCVLIRRAEQSLKLVSTGRRTFFQTLQEKLDWRGQLRYAK